MGLREGAAAAVIGACLAGCQMSATPLIRPPMADVPFSEISLADGKNQTKWVFRGDSYRSITSNDEIRLKEIEEGFYALQPRQRGIGGADSYYYALLRLDWDTGAATVYAVTVPAKEPADYGPCTVAGTGALCPRTIKAFVDYATRTIDEHGTPEPGDTADPTIQTARFRLLSLNARAFVPEAEKPAP